MNNITLITVTHNDENILNRFFEHHRPHFNEIIVTDDGSTDKSVEIAKKYADKVMSYERPKYWCEYHRDDMATQAQNDWVFSVDSDEFISFEVLLSLKEIIETPNVQEKGYATFKVRGYDDFIHRNHLDWDEIMLGDKKRLRWSKFPHCRVFNRITGEFPVTSPTYGTIFHFRSTKENIEGGLIKMLRWLDCAKWCVENLQEFSQDRNLCLNYLKTHNIDLLKIPYRCSKNPDTLDWIHNEEELITKLINDSKNDEDLKKKLIAYSIIK